MSSRRDGAIRDGAMMREALKLARRGKGKTSPNPMVGAVVVRRGTIVGGGYHRKAGGPHAEIAALQKAGSAAKGAQLYVNLEPCCHFGRTAPCTDAIIQAGIRRVVVGMVDPNPLVNGRGLAVLRRAGVVVECGVLERECRVLNEPFVVFITRRRPFVTLKSAMTLDGCVAARTGHARWVTGEAARHAGHRLRRDHDAIVVGIGKVLADNPQLTCRQVPGARDPLRVVVDSNLRMPAAAGVVSNVGGTGAPTLVVTTNRAPAPKAQALERRGVDVLRVAADREGRVKIPSLLRGLARRGVLSVLLEGGPTLVGAFWQVRAVDRIVAFIAPKVLGDPEALPMMRAAAPKRMDHATALEDMIVRRVGADLMVTARPVW